MSNSHTDTALDNAARVHAFDPATRPELFSGVLSKRFFGFLLDAAAIVVLTAIGWVATVVLGIFTLGLLWLLLGLVFPVIALCYTGFSLGGAHSATPGMRAMGLQMRQTDGDPMFTLLGMAHGLIFWVSVAGLTPFIVLVGLFNARKRLLHDFLLGTVVVNAEPAQRLLRKR